MGAGAATKRATHYRLRRGIPQAQRILRFEIKLPDVLFETKLPGSVCNFLFHLAAPSSIDKAFVPICANVDLCFHFVRVAKQSVCLRVTRSLWF